jgi:hypothetical protein
MAILHRPGPTRPALHRFYLPRRGGGAGTGRGFYPDHRGGALMGIGIDLPRLARPAPTFNNITKYWFLLLCDHNILGKTNSKQRIFVCVY